MGRLPWRATLAGLICASVLATAGCGGGDDAASPLDNALGYLGEDAPFAVSVDTDIRGDQYEAVDKIVRRFPFGNALKQRVRQALEDQGVRFKDIEGLLGNEFVLGATRVGSVAGGSSNADDYVGAIQTKSADGLQEVVRRERAEEIAEKNGAKVYETRGGDSFAVEDDVLIVAGSRGLLEDALAQREADDRLTEDTFDEGTRDLPKDGLLRVYADAQRMLASNPRTRDARKVEWVKALRTFGAAVSFEPDEANVDFRLDTDARQLTERDLPFASGSASPSVIDRAGAIAAGVRDPTQVVEFAERAVQATDPGRFGDYEAAKRQIEKRLGIDIENDLLAQLEGDLAVTYAVDGKFGVRARPRDPDRFDRTLARLGRLLPQLAERMLGEPVGYARRKKGGDFYTLATADGDGIIYGVIDGVFVLSNDPRTAGRLSKESTTAISGAKGSLVTNANAEALVRRILTRFEGLGGGLAGALITGPLDQLTGSMSTTRDGVTGTFKLTFD